MEDESKRSGQKAMRRESRGEEGLVSCCGDGDVVDVDEGDGDGLGEGRKGEKRLGCEFANAPKKRIIPRVQCMGHLIVQWRPHHYHILRSSLNGRAEHL